MFPLKVLHQTLAGMTPVKAYLEKFNFILVNELFSVKSNINDATKFSQYFISYKMTAS